MLGHAIILMTIDKFHDIFRQIDEISEFVSIDQENLNKFFAVDCSNK